MKKLFVLLAIFLTILQACQLDDENPNIFLSEFSYDTLLVIDPSNLDSTVLFNIDVQFPYWTNHEKCNALIEEMIASDIWTDSLLSLNNAIQYRINELRSISKEFGDLQTIGFILNGKIDTVYSDASWFILKYDRSLYTGGAHGISIIDAYLIDNNTLDPISFWEVLDTTQLRAPMEKALRKALGIDDEQPLNSASWIDTFEFPSTIYFDHQNIYAVYQPYEIRSFAEGPVIFSIPRSSNYFISN